MPDVIQHFIDLPNGLRVILEIDASQVHARITGLSDAIKSDWRPLFNKWGTMMRQSFAMTFAQGGRPDRWTPLSPNTIASKLLDGQMNGIVYSTARGRRRIRRLAQMNLAGQMSRSPLNILIASGALRDSYVQKNKDHVERVNMDGLEVGSKHRLAAVHNFGGKGDYTIRPRNAKMLRFRTMRGIVLAKEVRHPPMAPRPVAIIQPEDQAVIMADIMQRLGGTNA